MRRWLIVLILTVVQFQLAWGAVAPYCGHESAGAASQHFGHHDHKHEADSDSSEQADAESAQALAGAHIDCESCHLSSSGGISTPLVVAVVVAPSDVHADLDHDFRSHIPSGLERPDRSAKTTAA